MATISILVALALFLWQLPAGAATSAGKILLTALIYAVIGFFHWKLHPRTLAVTEGRTRERRVSLDFFFFATFALVVTSSVGLVGVLLVFALLVLPAVAALVLSQRAGARLAWGWGIAGAASLVGLQAAYHWDLPAAPMIVLVLGAFLIAAVVVGRTRRV